MRLRFAALCLTAAPFFLAACDDDASTADGTTSPGLTGGSGGAPAPGAGGSTSLAGRAGGSPVSNAGASAAGAPEASGGASASSGGQTGTGDAAGHPEQGGEGQGGAGSSGAAGQPGGGTSQAGSPGATGGSSSAGQAGGGVQAGGGSPISGAAGSPLAGGAGSALAAGAGGFNTGGDGEGGALAAGGAGGALTAGAGGLDAGGAGGALAAGGDGAGGSAGSDGASGSTGGAGGPTGPFRPLAPLSTATVTSQTPTLRWVLPPTADGALVELFYDRPGTQPIASVQASGSSFRPSDPLFPGVTYWRLTPTLGGAAVGPTSPMWQFVVGRRSAPVDSSWGSWLDLNGDSYADIAVGAPGLNDGAGAVYLYLESPLDLTPAPRVLTVPDLGPNSAFGTSVASAGDVNGDGFPDLIVGSPANAAWLYLGNESGVATTPMRLSSPDPTTSGFGLSVSTAGDVNGDGYGDVIVGAKGQAFVFLGSATGLNPTPLSLGGSHDSVSFGQSVSDAGDLNSDGYGDVVVGQFLTASAFVYFGGPSGPSSTPLMLTTGTNFDDTFAPQVACAGDLNGDGYADLALGSDGAVTLYLGGASGPSPTPITVSDTANGTAYYGAEVTSAGDLNGDGFGDLIVGSPDVTEGYRSTFFVYYGKEDINEFSLFEKEDIFSAVDSFSLSVAGVGDVNGDGYADLVVGSPGESEIDLFGGTERDVTVLMTPPTIAGPSGSDFGASVY